MSPFLAILVPLDGSATAARSLGLATWLSGRLGARLHILSATPVERPAREELARLRVPAEHWPLVTLHQAPAYPERAILAAVARHDARLVVMTARGEAAEAPPAEPPGAPRLVGHVARAVIEGSPVPVLLLPPAYREALPWQRILVPVSGEAEADEALALAVGLANALDLEVHVAHVAGPDAGDEGLAARARYADALHHEYPHQLQEFVRRALPHHGAEQCRCISKVELCHGDVGAELLRLIEDSRVSLLAVGWHGRFLSGRARVLTYLLERIGCPVLLVTGAPRPPFRLKVGEEIQ
jgi:nucleotide-binding universal stress UspA family protein